MDQAPSIKVLGHGRDVALIEVERREVWLRPCEGQGSFFETKLVDAHDISIIEVVLQKGPALLVPADHGQPVG